MKKFLKGFAICFVLVVGAVLFALSNQIGGLRAFIVSSGSMQPTISTGSLVITQYTHPRTLHKNDVITFIPPIKNREFVTHRVNDITQQKNLARIKTKGDNNKNIDAWTLAGGSVVGKVIYTIPYVGYFLAFAQSKIGLVLFVLFPAVYILLDEITVVWRTLKRSKPATRPQTATAFAFLLISTFVFSQESSFALLSDTATLTDNTISVATPSAQSACGTVTVNVSTSGDAQSSVNISSLCIKKESYTSTTISKTVIQTSD